MSEAPHIIHYWPSFKHFSLRGYYHCIHCFRLTNHWFMHTFASVSSSHLNSPELTGIPRNSLATEPLPAHNCSILAKNITQLFFFVIFVFFLLVCCCFHVFLPFHHETSQFVVILSLLCLFCVFLLFSLLNCFLYSFSLCNAVELSLSVFMRTNCSVL